MRISDWSSDVCSSDLQIDGTHPRLLEIGLTIGECRNRVEPIAGPREGRRPVEILLGIDRDPEAGPFARRKTDEVRRSRSIEQKIGRASCRERVCQYV